MHWHLPISFLTHLFPRASVPGVLLSRLTVPLAYPRSPYASEMAVEQPDAAQVLQPCHLYQQPDTYMSKKGQPWTNAEHAEFLSGLQKLGKGNWRGISKYYVPSRTPTQVASHAQKHFMRVAGTTKRKSRFAALERHGQDSNSAGAQSDAQPSTSTTSSSVAPLTPQRAQSHPQQQQFSPPHCLFPPMFFPYPGQPPFFPPFMCPPPPAFAAKGLFFPMLPPHSVPFRMDFTTARPAATQHQQHVCRPSAVHASSGQDATHLVAQLTAATQLHNTCSFQLSERSAFRAVHAINA